MTDGYAPKKHTKEQWAINHDNAWRRGGAHVASLQGGNWTDESRSEQAISSACHALKTYADAHKSRFDTHLADDYVLGPAWLQWLKGVRTLLNGITGRLDCGTVDGFLLNLAQEHGFREEDL